MKRTLTIAILAFLTLGAAAQESKPQQQAGKGNGWSEKIQAEKIGFITRQVGLTPEEAQAFWPVYNKAEAEQASINQAVRSTYKALAKAVSEKAEPAAIEKLTKEYTAALSQKVDIEGYRAKYAKILSAEKVAKLYMAEEKFRRQQITSLKQNEHMGHGHGPIDAKTYHGQPQGGQQGHRPNPQGGNHSQGGQHTL